jgi:hypothetical protein
MNSVNLRTILFTILIAAFVIWRVGSRVWRLTTKQPVRPLSLRVRSALLVLVILVMVATNLSHPLVLEGLAAGLAGGFAAGWFGLRGSTFENTPDGLFYTPHRGLGAAIALLFVGRIIYRGVQLYGTPNLVEVAGTYAGPASALGRSPLTMALFGLFAAYVTTYSIGVLIWYRDAKVTTVVTPAEAEAIAEQKAEEKAHGPG